MAARGGDGEADDADRLRRRILWELPSGLYLLGTAAGDRRNLMTLSWATQVATSPKLVAVSVEREALSHQLLVESGVFAVSVLERTDRPVVRRFAKPAVADDIGLSGERVLDAGGVPVLAGARCWLVCALRATLGGESGMPWSHSVFVGEVVAFGPEGFRGADGAALRMEDTRMSYGG